MVYFGNEKISGTNTDKPCGSKRRLGENACGRGARISRPISRPGRCAMPSSRLQALAGFHATAIGWDSELFDSLGDMHDIVAYRIQDQIADRVELELAHDVGAVRLRGFYAQPQVNRDFLSTLSFGQ
jgi:hypothetical protein